MWEWLAQTLRRYPEIAIFLTLAIGFWVGTFRFRSFSLGVVTSTLLAGVLVGQLGITISPNVKSTFFLMFLFAVGYGVGPQFFRGLKGDGLQQVVFAVVICVSCLACAVVMGKIMGYDAGLTAGLLSGACTISAVLGVATDSINRLDVPEEQKKAMIDAMPIAYAVTYIYGTAGSAWFLATLAPRLLGIDLKEECRKYEAEVSGAPQPAPGTVSAYQPFAFRAYRIGNGALVGKRVRDLEALFIGQRVFVERIRPPKGKIIDAEPDTVLEEGAVVAIAGRREALIEHEDKIGPEVDDRELMDIEAEALDVVVTNKSLAGKTLTEIAAASSQGGRGIFLRKVVRGGIEMPFGPGLKVDRGDALTLVGAKRDVERAAKLLGYADRVTEKTDMLFMGLGIVIGAIVGAITIRVAGIPLNLSTSGGALIAGLVCGYLRSVHRTFGRIPAPALWVFNNVGLNTFIAVVGIGAGPSFISGLKANGLGLLLAGVVVTTVPFIIAMYFGKYVLKMKPPILLGACAGGRTTTAALGALEEASGGSKATALGYTVTYAVGNTLLTIWGVVVVLLMK